MRKTKSAFLAAVIAAIMLVSTGCGAASSSSQLKAESSQPSSAVQQSSTAADSAAEDAKADGMGWPIQIDTLSLDGEKVTTADFEGNTLTVLNVWATWCSPCVKELPELQKISEAYADKGVQIVGVLDPTGEPGDDDVLGTAKTLLADAGAIYTVILPDETIIDTFLRNMQYFPTTFFIDSDGNVVDTIVGSNSYDDWSKHIDKALEKLGK